LKSPYYKCPSCFMEYYGINDIVEDKEEAEDEMQNNLTIEPTISPLYTAPDELTTEEEVDYLDNDFVRCDLPTSKPCIQFSSLGDFIQGRGVVWDQKCWLLGGLGCSYGGEPNCKICSFDPSENVEGFDLCPSCFLQELDLSIFGEGAGFGASVQSILELIEVAEEIYDDVETGTTASIEELQTDPLIIQVTEIPTTEPPIIQVTETPTDPLIVQVTTPPATTSPPTSIATLLQTTSSPTSAPTTDEGYQCILPTEFPCINLTTSKVMLYGVAVEYDAECADADIITKKSGCNSDFNPAYSPLCKICSISVYLNGIFDPCSACTFEYIKYLKH